MLALLVADFIRFVGLLFISRDTLVAENLFLRRRLALYKERGIKTRPVDAATRVSLRFCPDYSIGVTHWLSCVQRRWYVGTEQAGVCFGAGNAEAAVPHPVGTASIDSACGQRQSLVGRRASSMNCSSNWVCEWLPGWFISTCPRGYVARLVVINVGRRFSEITLGRSFPVISS